MSIKTETDNKVKKRRPARTPKARENQLISLAIDLAERQLREGTASSQVISHYLKLASSRDELEKEHLRKKNELLDAQIKAASSYENLEHLFQEAINAYKEYSGNKEDMDDEDEY